MPEKPQISNFLLPQSGTNSSTVLIMQIVEDIFDNAQSCKSSVIAVESPLQERIRLLTNLALKTKSVGKKCYLLTIDEDTFVEIGVGSNRKLTKYIVNDYEPFQTKNQPLDYHQK